MNTLSKIGFGATSAYLKAKSLIFKNSNAIMFVLGAGVLVTGLDSLSHAQTAGSFTEAGYNAFYIRAAVGNILGFLEGPFGALIMVIAGLGAIVAAALGAYKGALSMVVVAVGAFILRSLISLFFGNNFFAVVGSSQVNPGAGNFGGGGQIQN